MGFIGGQYEDDDFYRRLLYIEEESTKYIPKPSLWNISNTKNIFQQKWKHNDIDSIYDLDESKTIYKLLPEK